MPMSVVIKPASALTNLNTEENLRYMSLPDAEKQPIKVAALKKWLLKKDAEGKQRKRKEKEVVERVIIKEREKEAKYAKLEADRVRERDARFFFTWNQIR
jgi:hypothetical protein